MSIVGRMLVIHRRSLDSRCHFRRYRRLCALQALADNSRGLDKLYDHAIQQFASSMGMVDRDTAKILALVASYLGNSHVHRRYIVELYNNQMGGQLLIAGENHIPTQTKRKVGEDNSRQSWFGSSGYFFKWCPKRYSEFGSRLFIVNCYVTENKRDGVDQLAEQWRCSRRH